MKRVFSSTHEAIHIFANDPARDGRASSVSFSDGVLFSYNTAIAEHVTDAQGQPFIILNRTSYSNTTSKQQGRLFSAANHLQRIWVDHIPYNAQGLTPSRLDNKRLIERYEAEAAQWLAKAATARKNGDQYRANAFNHLTELKNYLAFFGIEYETGDLSELEAAAIESAKREREAEKARKAARIAEQAEALEKWRAGENVYRSFEVTALRVKGDTIETSRGANIPVEHAVKVWPLLKRLHDRGESYQHGSHAIHLGHYTLTSFSGDVLTVGCHKIPFSEVASIAQQLHLN